MTTESMTVDGVDLDAPLEVLARALWFAATAADRGGLYEGMVGKEFSEYVAGGHADWLSISETVRGLFRNAARHVLRVTGLAVPVPPKCLGEECPDLTYIRDAARRERREVGRILGQAPMEPLVKAAERAMAQKGTPAQATPSDAVVSTLVGLLEELRAMEARVTVIDRKVDSLAFSGEETGREVVRVQGSVEKIALRVSRIEGLMPKFDGEGS